MTSIFYVTHVYEGTLLYYQSKGSWNHNREFAVGWASKRHAERIIEVHDSAKWGFTPEVLEVIVEEEVEWTTVGVDARMPSFKAWSGMKGERDLKR